MSFHVDGVTSRGIKEEQKRVERTKEQAKRHDQLLTSFGIDDSRLILDFDPSDDSPRVEVDPVIVKELKQHQRDGIKFLYESTIESVERLQESGSGCVLSHHAGLGKRLQAITFIHTILSHPVTHRHIQSILIITPQNAIQSWHKEFYKWICGMGLEKLKVHKVDSKDPSVMIHSLNLWDKTGKVLIIDQLAFEEAFLVHSKKERAFHKLLLNPGPDMVIIDDGPSLYVPISRIHRAISIMRTRRKIILTDKPILDGASGIFYSMVSLVKHPILSNYVEFAEQYDDPPHSSMLISWEGLLELLSNCVHQVTTGTLKCLLKPKYEYALLIRPTEVITNMYNYYLERANFKDHAHRVSDSVLFTVNHPALHQEFKATKLQTPGKGNRYLEWVPFGSVNTGRSGSAENELERDWFGLFTQPDDWKKIELSNKFVLLFKILRKCIQVGDKLLVASQSCETLNLIEKCLKDRTNDEGTEWRENVTYFRLDRGYEQRNEKMNKMNDPGNREARLCLLPTYTDLIGISLEGANRCIFFDVQSNSNHDQRIVSLLFRMGQTKSVYVYRFATQNTFEEQLTRRKFCSESLRRMTRAHEADELYRVRPSKTCITPSIDYPSDHLLISIFNDGNQEISSCINLDEKEKPNEPSIVSNDETSTIQPQSLSIDVSSESLEPLELTEQETTQDDDSDESFIYIPEPLDEPN